MSITMREMLEAGVHFGHQTRFWNPKMAPFIFGHRNKIHIINLEQSLPMFQDAAKFARQLSANRGTILMVGTKRQAREIVAAEARRAGVPFVDQRWLGGMLTNFKTVKTSIKRLKDMKAQLETGLDAMSKKEQLMFNRELEKLEKDIGGIQDMATLPDAIFVIDVGYHKIAIAEAKKLGIPLIGVVDTNHSPEGIDYVIPGNDDSSKAVTLYARGIADAILEGRANAVQEVVKAVAEGEDEFVELDENGNPKPKGARGGKPRREAPAGRPPRRGGAAAAPARRRPMVASVAPAAEAEEAEVDVPEAAADGEVAPTASASAPRRKAGPTGAPRRRG